MNPMTPESHLRWTYGFNLGTTFDKHPTAFSYLDHEILICSTLVSITLSVVNLITFSDINTPIIDTND